MNKRTVIIIVALVSLVCIAVGANFYFMYYLNAEEIPLSSTRALENVIRSKIRHLKPSYLNRNPRFFMYRNKLLKNYKPAAYENASVLWDIANWVSSSKGGMSKAKTKKKKTLIMRINMYSVENFDQNNEY